MQPRNRAEWDDLLFNTKRPDSGAGWPTWGHRAGQSWEIITSEGRGSRCWKSVLFKALWLPREALAASQVMHPSTFNFIFPM